MAWGPELTPEQLKSRRTVISRIGGVVLVGMIAFVIFAAAGGLKMF